MFRGKNVGFWEGKRFFGQNFDLSCQNIPGATDNCDKLIILVFLGLPKRWAHAQTNVSALFCSHLTPLPSWSNFYSNYKKRTWPCHYVPQPTAFAAVTLRWFQNETPKMWLVCYRNTIQMQKIYWNKTFPRNHTPATTKQLSKDSFRHCFS